MKLFVNFHNGAPRNILNEPMLDELVKQGLTKKLDWECYTPEQKFIIPWVNDFHPDELPTLEELKMSYVKAIVGRCKNATQAAKKLDIDRKTMYRYIEQLDNKKWLENKE